MALINDNYIFVKSEEVLRNTEISSHPVEEGPDLTDCVRRSPLTLSLAGEVAGEDYTEVLSELERIQKSGELIEYVGLNVVSDMLLTRFSSSHTEAIRGGCAFTAELKEVRIAASPFTGGSGNSGTQQIEESPTAAPVRTHEVKPGENLWKIAQSYYGNGALFPDIFHANRDQLSDANRIHAGQVLVIP